MRRGDASKKIHAATVEALFGQFRRVRPENGPSEEQGREILFKQCSGTQEKRTYGDWPTWHSGS
jgi:hypothetical protein